MLTVSKGENDVRPLLAVGKRESSAPQVGVLARRPPPVSGSGTTRRRLFRRVTGVVRFAVAITAAERQGREPSLTETWTSCQTMPGRLRKRHGSQRLVLGTTEAGKECAWYVERLSVSRRVGKLEAEERQTPRAAAGGCSVGGRAGRMEQTRGAMGWAEGGAQLRLARLAKKAGTPSPTL